MNIKINSLTENKLLAKDDFLQLDKLLNRFNIFEATDMSMQEIKHTKFLSYLLDPNQSHGLGEAFIKNFVARISEKFANFPKILDLDFSFAEVKPEFRFSEDKKDAKKNSLDILMKIPLRSASDKHIILAIENKIGSKQGATQLQDYSSALSSKFNNEEKAGRLFKLYLTVNDEEVNDVEWESITYGNIVLPAVNTTIDALKNRGSQHLEATLINYYELLMEDEYGEQEKEVLANILIQDNEIKAFIGAGRQEKDKKRSFGDMYIKHKKAIDYLCQFDGDERTKALKWWKTLEKIKLPIDESEEGRNLIIQYETSVRSYLRFSILTEQNREGLLRLSMPSKERKWLESRCPIAYEIMMTKNKSKDDEKSPVRCWASLTLGPVKEEYRLDLMKAIYPALQRNKEKRQFKDNLCNDFWNRLITNKSGEWTKGSSKNTPDPQSWVEDHVINFDRSKNKIIVQDWIKELAINLNKALDDYFKKLA